MAARCASMAALCALALFALAGPAGATPVFLTPVNISDAGQDGFEGVVAVDSTGQTHYAWTRSDGTNLRIQYRSRDVNGNFGAVQTISDPGQNASDPDIAVDPSNNVLLAWSRTTARTSAFRPPSSRRPAGSPPRRRSPIPASTRPSPRPTSTTRAVRC